MRRLGFAGVVLVALLASEGAAGAQLVGTEPTSPPPTVLEGATPAGPPPTVLQGAATGLEGTAPGLVGTPPAAAPAAATTPSTVRAVPAATNRPRSTGLASTGIATVPLTAAGLALVLLGWYLVRAGWGVYVRTSDAAGRAAATLEQALRIPRL
jgi:hypothetical protein